MPRLLLISAENAALRRALAGTLAGSGCQVQVVDARIGLTEAFDWQPDAVVADLSREHDRVLDLASALCEQDALAGVKVIAAGQAPASTRETLARTRCSVVLSGLTGTDTLLAALRRIEPERRAPNRERHTADPGFQTRGPWPGDDEKVRRDS